MFKVEISNISEILNREPYVTEVSDNNYMIFLKNSSISFIKRDGEVFVIVVHNGKCEYYSGINKDLSAVKRHTRYVGSSLCRSIVKTHDGRSRNIKVKIRNVESGDIFILDENDTSEHQIFKQNILSNIPQFNESFPFTGIREMFMDECSHMSLESQRLFYDFCQQRTPTLDMNSAYCYPYSHSNRE